MALPRGRPLAEHAWRDGKWCHAVTGEPFNEEVYMAGVRRRQAECERRRYWDNSSGTRHRRLLRSMRDAANRPRKRRTAMQLTLESVPRSGAAELRRSLNVASRVEHPEENQDASGACCCDIVMTCSGEGLTTLHGHAHDPVAKIGG